MTTLKERIVETLSRHPGLTDREIAEIVLGRGKPQQAVNQACRQLEKSGHVRRSYRPDGFIGNSLVPLDQRPLATSQVSSNLVPKSEIGTEIDFSEDRLKQRLFDWLAADGWTVQIAW